MLIVQFGHTFRERFPEWVTSGMLLLWGLSLLSSPESFQLSYYSSLSLLASQTFWGGMAVTMGVVRLVSLYINGRRKQTPAARMCGAAMGIIIWFGVFVGGLVHYGLTPSVALYMGLTVLDAAALYFATVDAKKVSKNKGLHG